MRPCTLTLLSGIHGNLMPFGGRVVEVLTSKYTSSFQKSSCTLETTDHTMSLHHINACL